MMGEIIFFTKKHFLNCAKSSKMNLQRNEKVFLTGRSKKLKRVRVCRKRKNPIFLQLTRTN
jgi:hypothetical protein